jgi:hypothetical protein
VTVTLYDKKILKTFVDFANVIKNLEMRRSCIIQMGSKYNDIRDSHKKILHLHTLCVHVRESERKEEEEEGRNVKGREIEVICHQPRISTASRRQKM